MVNFNKLLILCVSLFCLQFTTTAQDIHYAQFYNAPQILNPALTGIFNGDVRFMGHYRRQWEDVPVDFLTFSGNFDMKLYPQRRDDNNFWGLGVNFNYDRGGYSRLALGQLQLGGSYSMELSKNTFLTGGVQVGFAQRRFKADDLTFDAQYDGERFDPGLPTGENYDNESFGFADISLGANLRLQNDDRRTKLDFGVGLYHLNQPNQSYYDVDNIKLDSRFSVHALGSIKLAEIFDLLANGTLQYQGKFNENVFGLAGRIYLNQKRGKEFAFQAGANLRLNSITDAIIPTVELHLNALSVGVSYDVNISDFEQVTDGKGGPEIWVSYRIIKVKPLSQFKTCPIF